MNTFYFESGLADTLGKGLSDMKETLDNISEKVKKIKEELGINTGFGIEQIIEDVGSTIGSITFIGNSAVAGAQAIKAIKGSLEDHSATAAGIVFMADNWNKKMSDTVIKWKAGVDSTASAPSEDTASRWPAGVVTNDDTYEKDGLIYTPLKRWNDTVVHLRTDGAGGIGLFNENDSYFETYIQHNQQFSHGEWPWQECTSTALAQSSTINGIYRQANDYNAPGAYHPDGTPDGGTQIGGYPASSEDITRFCVDNLKEGYSTVIYYNYYGNDHAGINGGHAVTVVGANANPTSVYDLNIIDPDTGAYVNFSKATNVCTNSMYICYELSPNEYGGAGIKRWDIENYFNNNM